MKNRILIILFLSLSLANNVGNGLAFLNVPATARSSSLGNTMFSDLSNPSSILINPSNTWHQSSYKLSLNNVIFHPELDIQLNHSFLSFKLMESSMTLGFIQHGIDDIESYGDDAIFNGYISFSDLAFLIGYAYKTSNINWGISSTVISENFSNIDYESSYYFQYDIGMSFINMPITNTIDFSTGITLKNVVDKDFKAQNSANSNNIFGSMFSYSGINSPLKINSYFDFLFQKTLDVYTGRFGLEVSYDFNVKSKVDRFGNVKYKPYGISFCFGYNDFRFTALDNFDLQKTNQYNSQLKYGIGITIPLFGHKVDIFGGHTFDSSTNPLKAKFMSINFSKDNKF
tara:strand:+ start:18047 stop:19075 length:1029 start_codon:yes stop_codon:yes gene_type:complete